MSSAAILASGSGSNFEAIVERVSTTDQSVVCLICDRKGALVLERANRLAIPAHHVSYYKRERREAEVEIESILCDYGPDLVILAGFMRILTPNFVKAFTGRIVNVHPALLPSHPGANGLKSSFSSADKRLGITVHYVDVGTDTGPVIRQESFEREGTESLEEIERRIHELEHSVFPDVVVNILDAKNRDNGSER